MISSCRQSSINRIVLPKGMSPKEFFFDDVLNNLWVGDGGGCFFLNLPPVFLPGTSENALQYSIHKGGGVTSDPAKIVELNAGQTKKVAERKKERQGS